MQEPQKVRINKLLSQAGVASRREAEKLIHAGSVILNGKTVTEPGQTMLPGTDHLTVEGRKIRFHQTPKTKVFAQTLWFLEFGGIGFSCLPPSDDPSPEAWSVQVRLPFFH